MLRFTRFEEVAGAGGQPARRCALRDPPSPGPSTDTVTYDGKVPNLKPLAMDADPVCASKHKEPVPNQMLELGKSGNTMGNILVRVTSGLPAGKTYPAPKDPVVMDQNGCLYQAARVRHAAGPDPQGAELRRRAAQRARAAQGERPVQHGDAGRPARRPSTSSTSPRTRSRSSATCTRG